MNSTVKTIIFWVFILACLVLLWQIVQKSTGMSHDREISFTQLMQDAQQSKIADVTMMTGEVHGHYNDREAFHANVPTNYPDMYKILAENKVVMNVKEGQGNSWLPILLNFAPIIVIAALWFFMLRQMQSGGNKALSVWQESGSPAFHAAKKITFKDVAGVDEAKEELKEIIEFLREAQKFQKLGGRIPKGVLLVGPPGTGKTLLARAVAGEANVPFFSISGSDFVEMFVGVGASRVRDLFEQGKKNAPCIIFIDEIDAVGRHRGAGLGGGHDEREQTLNQLLVEMDGFESNDGVILIAATNRPDVLDPALLRPGRFDRRVVVGRPDVRGREEVLRVHAKKVPLAEDVDLRILARGTPGFSGADLANMVNEAALNAARANRKAVHQFDFELAKDKVMMGAERKSMLLSEDDKRDTAYHEAGHVLVAAMRDHADPLHKVTIIPRGMALGVTMQLPEEDKHTVTKDYLDTQLAILMGGRCAEEIFMNRKTTGAGNDIERATDLARKMVCEYGMSRMGPLTFGKKEEQIFLGREIAQHRDFSEETARQIDAEVRSLVDEAYKSAYSILGDNKDTMHRMAQALLDRETLDANDIRMIIEGKELPPLPPLPPSGPTGGEVQHVMKPEDGPGTWVWRRKPAFPCLESKMGHLWSSVPRCLLFAWLGLSGCGYHTLGSAAHLPDSVHTLAVPIFKNKTQFYHSEVPMTQAVVAEFTDRTRLHLVTSSDGADATVAGTIISESVQPLTYRTQTTTAALGQTTSTTSSFLVTINLNVLVTDRDSRVLYQHTNYVFHEQFETTSDLASFIEEDSPAVERLSRDFAQALVSDILESF